MLMFINKIKIWTNEIVEFALSTYKSSQVISDDILDAVVNAITAASVPNQLRTLPNSPEFDSRGLPMQMVYRLISDNRR